MCFRGTGKIPLRGILPYPLASLVPRSARDSMAARLLAVPLQHIPRSFSFLWRQMSAI